MECWGTVVEFVDYGWEMADRSSGVLRDVAVASTTGTSDDELISGTADQDVIIADAGDDWIGGGAGSDTIDGGAGIDSVWFDGELSDFSVVEGENGIVTVTHLFDLETAEIWQKDHGTDTLTNVEWIEFWDSSLELYAQEEDAVSTVTVRHWKDAIPMDGVVFGENLESDTAGEANLSANMALLEPAFASDTVADDAVNLQDAIMVLKSIVGLESFDQYQDIAADFDGNGNAELNDAIGILQHVVGLSSPEPEWVIVEAGESPDPEAVIDLSAGENVELVGILRGDVDGSWAGAQQVVTGTVSD